MGSGSGKLVNSEDDYNSSIIELHGGVCNSSMLAGTIFYILKYEDSKEILDKKNYILVSCNNIHYINYIYIKSGNFVLGKPYTITDIDMNYSSVIISCYHKNKKRYIYDVCDFK